MTTAARMQSGALALPPHLLTHDESFHAQPVAVQNNVSSSKSRSELIGIPRLMDNPLYEGSAERDPGACVINAQAPEQRRIPLSRLSLEESKFGKPSRRQQSLSLSSRDYEGMFRAVQEDVFKSTQDSVSALEDFKQFRQKLAHLKQVKEGGSIPTVLTPSGSTRSLNLASVSARSLNLSPSRPTSPLKRLSVLTSRKGVSGLNPQRDSQKVSLPPSMQKIAVSMRAEGLFRIPNPASISPLIPEHSPPPALLQTVDVVANTSISSASKRRSSTGVRGGPNHGKKAPETTTRAILTAPNDAESYIGASCTPRAPRILRSAAQTRSNASNDDESAFVSCAPRTFGSHIPRTVWNAPQQQPTKKKTEKVTPSCSPRAKDMKARCIHIPRPMCYSAHILE